MAAFVLVPGAWYTGWHWHEVVSLLEAEGHRAEALDLPGHGSNAAPVAERTLETFARHIAERVSAAGEPVVLAGHSMGGISITQAAELVPEQLAALVYVTAFLPADGQALPDLASHDPEDIVQANIVPDEASGTCTVAEAVRIDAFFSSCDPEVAAEAAARLEPESLAAIGGRVAITDERAGSVRRVYVECLDDRALTIDLQRAMQAARPCERVFSLAADHAPFLSAPRALADALLAV